MAPFPTHSLETIHRARDLYRAGAPVRKICTETGLSVGALYHHLDGLSLPGSVPPRVPRRRIVAGNAQKLPASGARRRLAARLFRATEQQVRKIELRLSLGHQSYEQRNHDLTALREIAKIFRDLCVLEAAGATPRPRRRSDASAGETGPVEHETALAVEGRALYVRRERRG